MPTLDKAEILRKQAIDKRDHPRKQVKDATVVAMIVEFVNSNKGYEPNLQTRFSAKSTASNIVTKLNKRILALELSDKVFAVATDDEGVCFVNVTPKPVVAESK